MFEKRIVSYLKAGFLLHLITLIGILLFFYLVYYVDIRAWVVNDHTFLKLVALSPTVGMPFFAQLDARSRYQNYKLVRDNLYIYGFQKRILKPFIKSRCQRDAAKAAAQELGMLHLCNEHFKSCGYRWYHLLPDYVFDKPSVLITKNFWQTTLFAETYHSKIKGENIFVEPRK
jgi:hypothetical protein